jgi:hypothetical protein
MQLRQRARQRKAEPSNPELSAEHAVDLSEQGEGVGDIFFGDTDTGIADTDHGTPSGLISVSTVIVERFLVNFTLRLFDAASEIGLPPHKTDFGQTLYAYGAGLGPYLVLPLLSPSNLRDGIGLVADVLLNSSSWLLEPEENLIITAGTG